MDVKQYYLLMLTCECYNEKVFNWLCAYVNAESRSTGSLEIMDQI